MDNLTNYLARQNTNKLFDAVADGSISKDFLISSMLNYMSEEQVTDLIQYMGMDYLLEGGEE